MNKYQKELEIMCHSYVPLKELVDYVPLKELVDYVPLKELVGKATPKKLVIKGSTKRCPNCNKHITHINCTKIDIKHCAKCGQALDWEENNYE